MSGSYERALEAAGVPVLAFASFGSYQGDWIAKVPGGYICGSYGSCSGCDAFEAEFGFTDNEWCDDHYGGREPGCGDCDVAAAKYLTRLMAFGRNYLEQLTDYTTLRKRFVEEGEWDMDAKEIVSWLDHEEVA